MITDKCLTTILPVVADSWDRLRGCDVYRLLDQIAYDSAESIDQAASVIKSRRPDLAGDADEAARDLAGEYDFETHDSEILSWFER